jgi:hypothetical protein
VITASAEKPDKGKIPLVITRIETLPLYAISSFEAEQERFISPDFCSMDLIAIRRRDEGVFLAHQDIRIYGFCRGWGRPIVVTGFPEAGGLIGWGGSGSVREARPCPAGYSAGT